MFLKMFNCVLEKKIDLNILFTKCLEYFILSKWFCCIPNNANKLLKVKHFFLFFTHILVWGMFLKKCIHDFVYKMTIYYFHIRIWPCKVSIFKCFILISDLFNWNIYLNDYNNLLLKEQVNQLFTNCLIFLV